MINMNYINKIILSSSTKIHSDRYYCNVFHNLYRKLTTSLNHISNANTNETINSNSDNIGIRINRCFPNYSRKQVDELIISKRIKINGKIANLGDRIPYNNLQSSSSSNNDNSSIDTVIELDSQVINWKSHVHKVLEPLPKGLAMNNGFVYLKYWKDRNITTTTSQYVTNSILNTGHFDKILSASSNSRLFPIGRLDNQSTGIILLTSDARLSAWLLGVQSGCSKVYQVELDRPPTSKDLLTWRKGLTIHTPSSSGLQLRSHPTLPCKVVTHSITSLPSKAHPHKLPHTTQIPKTSKSQQDTTDRTSQDMISCQVEFTLKEGRNQQIRKMVHTLGYTTKHLHRSSFCGITLDGLTKPGTWSYLTIEELELLKKRQ